MYFPYLRGRQFELLALRELVEKGLIGDKIFPIIEPIKPTPTFIKTLKIYSQNRKNIAVVLNPQVGNFVDDINSMKGKDKEKTVGKPLLEGIKNENTIKSYIMNHSIVNYIAEQEQNERFIIINKSRDSLNDYLSLYNDKSPIFSLIPDDRSFKKNIKKGKILFGDKFKKKSRNVDYIDNEDEFFSDDHLAFKDEGYDGFADYSVVGEEFNESGFAPLAVAIHIVYFDKELNLRIRHFVSDSNEDISDPAGKFEEALRKLIEWVEEGNVFKTEAIKQFIECYTTGKYPGLGTVKKLSIMHHLQLINMYLEEEI